ncbi:2Fe-2S iron-sulfur cluster-binding protein [Bacteroidota bacterium]
MRQSNNLVSLTIDDQQLTVKKGYTIFQAAKENDIYIPSLCAHKDLTPFGGCRICIVEVKGNKKNPTACTTPIDEGMVVKTNSKSIQAERREILQLILSEHPSGCLICGDLEDCEKFQDTIRKVGSTTGCKWCPNDGDCELEQVVKYCGIDQLDFPALYRGFPLEKDEPFFDRDYNLCIYCSRCVRICQEQRKSSVLTLKQRGKYTTIGAAFDQSHIDGNCEFCGACVSVCPTGALSEKYRKWAGVPDKYTQSTCPACSMQCDIQVLSKGKTIIGTLPPGEPHLSGGELCVKGRFTLSQLVNHPDRLHEPIYQYPEGEGIVSWDTAIDKAKDALGKFSGEKTAVYVSPNLTTEELSAVKIFVNKVIKSPYVTSSALDSKTIAYLNISKKSIDFKKIKKADSIISIFLNGNFNYAPLTIAIKSAAEKGTPYVQIGLLKDTTTRFAKLKLTPNGGNESNFFKELIKSIKSPANAKGEIKDFIEILQKSSSPLFILGPGLLDITESEKIIDSIEEIIKLTKSELYTVNPYSNIAGLVSVLKTQAKEEVEKLISQSKIDLLYLIGDNPFDEKPNVKFLIHQNPFPPKEMFADLALPTTVWGESAGFYFDIHGAKKKTKAIAEPPEFAFPIQDIFKRISFAMKKRTLKFSTSDIKSGIPAKFSLNLPDISKIPVKHIKAASDIKKPFYLIQEKSGHRFFNVNINRVVLGMCQLSPLDTIFMNPYDAEKIGLNQGETVIVKNGSVEKKYSAITRKSIIPNYLYLIPSSGSFDFHTNPCPVSIRRENV